MVRADSDMDIAEDEPTAGIGTEYTIKKELDRVATGPNSDPDPHTNISVSMAPAQSSVVYMRDPGTEDSQGHTDSQLTLSDYEEMIGSIKSDPVNETGGIIGSDSSNKPVNEVTIEIDHKASNNESVESWRQTMMNACRVDNSGESNMDEETTNFAEDSSGRNPPDLPFQYIKDGFDLKPGRDSTYKARNRPIHEPLIIEEPAKRIQLHRRKPPIDSSRTDEGPSYGLPDDDPLQPDDMNLKITSVMGGCTETKDDTQELKVEPAPDISDTRDRMFAEIEKDDTGNIDISGLSLNIDLKQITVLRQIFQEKRK